MPRAQVGFGALWERCCGHPPRLEDPCGCIAWNVRRRWGQGGTPQDFPRGGEVLLVLMSLRAGAIVLDALACPGDGIQHTLIYCTKWPSGADKNLCERV